MGLQYDHRIWSQAAFRARGSQHTARGPHPAHKLQNFSLNSDNFD
jgi:hypothetical protein